MKDRCIILQCIAVCDSFCICHLKIGWHHTSHSFNEGKTSQYDIQSTLTELKGALRLQGNLRRMFVAIQLQAAYADGELSESEISVLTQVCQALNISSAEFNEIGRAHV